MGKSGKYESPTLFQVGKIDGKGGYQIQLSYLKISVGEILPLKKVGKGFFVQIFLTKLSQRNVFKKRLLPNAPCRKSLISAFIIDSFVKKLVRTYSVRCWSGPIATGLFGSQRNWTSEALYIPEKFNNVTRSLIFLPNIWKLTAFKHRLALLLIKRKFSQIHGAVESGLDSCWNNNRAIWRNWC